MRLRRLVLAPGHQTTANPLACHRGIGQFVANNRSNRRARGRFDGAGKENQDDGFCRPSRICRKSCPVRKFLAGRRDLPGLARTGRPPRPLVRADSTGAALGALDHQTTSESGCAQSIHCASPPAPRQGRPLVAQSGCGGTGPGTTRITEHTGHVADGICMQWKVVLVAKGLLANAWAMVWWTLEWRG